MCGKNRLYSFKNKELMATAMKFAQARLSPPLAQVAAEAALDTPQSYFDEVTRISRTQTPLVAELEKIAGVKVANQKRSFYCIAELLLTTQIILHNGY
jgi:aspartate aminotransferase